MGRPVAPNQIGRIDEMIKDAIAAIPATTHVWGDLTGAVADQVDLQLELDDKPSVTSVSMQSFAGAIQFLGGLAPAALTAAVAPADLLRKAEFDADQLAQNILLIGYLAAYQPLDAGLTDFAGVIGSADDMLYYTDVDQLAAFATTALGRSLLAGVTANGIQQIIDTEVGVDVLAHDAFVQSIADGVYSKFDMILANNATTAIPITTGTTGRDLLAAANVAAAVAIIISGFGGLAPLDTISDDQWSGADLAVINGGTGASTAEAARLNLDIMHQREREYVNFTDWWSNDIDASGYQQNTAGTGAGSRQLWEFTTTGAGNNQGVLELGTGTTATGFISIHMGNNCVVLSTAAFKWAARLCMWALSAAADEYVCRAGFSNDVTSTGVGSRECYFRYDRVAHGANWQCVTRNTTETVTDSGVAVAFSATGDNMQVLSIDMNAAATSVTFNIDGADVAVHTTTMPNNRLGHGIQMEASAYTSAEPRVGIDWIRASTTRTTDR